jgi:hypothetical protein
MDTTNMHELERSLAYEFAVSVIDSHSLAATIAGKVEISDAHDVTPREGDDYSDLVAEAVRYLDWRGLIERSTDNPNVIWIRDESEGR